MSLKPWFVANPKVKAGVAWYERLVGDATERTPKHPVDIATTLTVPVLRLYGSQSRIRHACCCIANAGDRIDNG